MPRTRDCDYCGQDIEPGTGTMLVHNDGSTTHFCSSKCENNADLGREARNLGWTDAGRATTAAEQQAAAEAAKAAADAEEAEDADEASEADETDADDAEEDDEADDAEEAEA
ncbi:50S ribosomal protein L24e [Haloarcula onubensis]|uniref:Large ribosomal subunit protein eL24 n=1 Tax=Haloarcula onubensis TaxID=2950539 RepID=A0ABU2FRC0_9EURY|nr:50S ribosomal protein L24e [Halomicroarcula sp. S3CR25-11]MDS0283313.1 50S ribosomal protein L24e [Halomicroarcula sp. S3CR25-11]